MELPLERRDTIQGLWGTFTCQLANVLFTESQGGLVILDLERFARALRLRWLWFQWRHKERAWTNLELSCDKRDRDLFAASTVVTIGDGKTASFWTGRTSKSIAPTLFKKS
jgi:hypothetical protein